MKISIKNNPFTAHSTGDSKVFQIWNDSDLSPIRWAEIKHRHIEFTPQCGRISETELEQILQLFKKVNSKSNSVSPL